MNPDTFRLALQIIGVVIGGGILEFARRMINRRAELRELDSRSSAVALESQNSYIKTLQEGEKTLRRELVEVNLRLDKKDVEIERLKELVATERRDTGRVRTELGIVRGDLDIAQAQIAKLTYKLTGGI